jgi:isocitrate/isopropylmalate dehydrogenase
MAALGRVLQARAVRTRDLGGTASTFEFADAVCSAIG